MPEGDLTSARACTIQLRTLEQVVPVDYTIPGCPPNHEQIWNAHHGGASRASCRPPASLLGVDRRTVCDQCPRVRAGQDRVERFVRPHEVIADPSAASWSRG